MIEVKDIKGKIDKLVDRLKNDDALKPGRIDAAPAAAPPGPCRRVAADELRLGLGRVRACLRVVEERQAHLVCRNPLGPRGEEAQVGKLDLLDQRVDRRLQGGDPRGHLGERRRPLGGLGGEPGVVRGERLVVARERRELRPQQGDLLLGGGGRGCRLPSAHVHIIPQSRR